jgi:phage gp29-like protein
MNIRFDRVTEKMLFGIHYGYAVAEIIWKIEGGLVGIDSIRVRDRLRFRFDREGRLRLLTTAHPEGELMPDAKFWTYNCGADNDDEFYGEGLGYALYWPVWFKREGLRSWLQGLDKTARPTAVGKFPNGATPEDVEKLLETLRAYASDTGIALPEAMSMELLEAKRTGTADYNTLYGRMDAAIAKIVLSQTMTTDSSASGLGSNQADVHADVKLDVVKADADLLSESFNETVARWITEWNFPGAATPVFGRQVEEPEDLDAASERDERLYGMGFRPTPDRISEIYGEGYEQFERSAAPPAVPPAGETGDFAEAHTHDQDEVDALTELALGDWQALMEPMVSPIRDLVERASSYEEVRDGLIGLLGEMDDEALTTNLAQAGFNVRLAAEIGAIGEDEDD